MEELRSRVEAVERALSDGDGDLTALAEGAAAADRVDSLAADVESLEEAVAELEAATQALRGYVGNVRSVNESVEERADAALAAVEKLEARVEDLEGADAPGDGRPRRERSARGTPSLGGDHEGAGASRAEGTDVCGACGRPGASQRTGSSGRRRAPDASGGPRGRPDRLERSPVGNGADGKAGHEEVGGPAADGRGERARSALARSRSAQRGAGDRRDEGAEPGFLERIRERL